eukprot:m.116662 g.116662  ORF g.116662 m.116662 type:complete len:568 (+) comp14472_c1_seq2:953-2656(+)
MARQLRPPEVVRGRKDSSSTTDSRAGEPAGPEEPPSKLTPTLPCLPSGDPLLAELGLLNCEPNPKPLSSKSKSLEDMLIQREYCFLFVWKKKADKRLCSLCRHLGTMAAQSAASALRARMLRRRGVVEESVAPVSPVPLEATRATLPEPQAAPLAPPQITDLVDISPPSKQPLLEPISPALPPSKDAPDKEAPAKRKRSEADLVSLLAVSSHKEEQQHKHSAELLEVLNAQSAMEKSLISKLRTRDGDAVQEFCAHITAELCVRASGGTQPCALLHFRPIIRRQTDVTLGNCAFLHGCHNYARCRYIHYQLERPRADSRRATALAAAAPGPAEQAGSDLIPTQIDKADLRVYPPQWIQCDLRHVNFSFLGQFSVIMADPPWAINMELPYGTMEDPEMLRLDVPSLQTDGFIFLWVTGRAMELGRECLKRWGYERVDELIWIKTNQLHRLIRTGRTGHFLNHSKEHCLIGRKGKPTHTAGIDCDVLVSEIRDISRKPDEVYGLIERLSPGTRKIELFGRTHNVQKNWITLGNQLEGVHLVDPDLIDRFKAVYPGPVEQAQRMLLTGRP